MPAACWTRREIEHATGTFDECRAKLELIRREQNLEPMRGKAVLLLHGLAAPAWSMQLLARHLQKHGGFQVFVVEYSSLRSTIDDQARSLASIINHLDGIDEIHLVGHSMGNIVIRRYLAGDKTPLDGWQTRSSGRSHRDDCPTQPWLKYRRAALGQLRVQSGVRRVGASAGRELGRSGETTGHTRCASLASLPGVGAIRSD